jgi:tetratricopeptide (TPR) repeat protein
MRGNSLLKLGKFPEAFECYRKSLELKPDNVKIENMVNDLINLTENLI